MKLEIVKFGPIENSIFDIKDVNIFIGESATGKSIITKLIYISNTFIRFIISKGTKELLIKITPIFPLKSASINPGEFKTVIPCFNANPDRDLTSPLKSSGTSASCKSVSIQILCPG